MRFAQACAFGTARASLDHSSDDRLRSVLSRQSPRQNPSTGDFMSRETHDREATMANHLSAGNVSERLLLAVVIGIGSVY
jgi:hypothetical protein